jgi:hypothetical protein
VHGRRRYRRGCDCHSGYLREKTASGGLLHMTSLPPYGGMPPFGGMQNAKCRM